MHIRHLFNPFYNSTKGAPHAAPHERESIVLVRSSNDPAPPPRQCSSPYALPPLPFSSLFP
jgi:hypothetical protein